MTKKTSKKKFVPPPKLTKRQEAARVNKKKNAVNNLVRNISRLRNHMRRDIKSKDLRTAYKAMAVIMIDKTAERVGNAESAKEGHFGITGLRCRHVTVRGNRVHLKYVGKSGVSQDKAFTDPDVAKLLRKRMKTCKRNESVIPVGSDSINRYLKPFGITAKDIRGYQSNKLMTQALSKWKGRVKGEKERKKVFLAEVKKVAGKVGHQPATLRKHYLLPNFEDNYVKHGRLPGV